MRNLAITLAFGKRKYRKMAKLLEIGVRTFSPETEFRVLSANDIDARPVRRRKDRCRGKLELLAQCNDPDTRYIFIDSDTFVFCDLGPLFDLIRKDTITLHWKESPGGKWAGIQELDFPRRCREAGIEGNIEAYNINSGFMLWQGGTDVFGKALELFDAYDIQDWKGMGGDEYYICAAIQLTGVQVQSIDRYDANEMRFYWRGNLSVKDGMLFSDAYETQGKIQHYGAGNFKNKHVQKVAKSILRRYYRPAGAWKRILARAGIY